jgi:polyphenol oxidase
MFTSDNKVVWGFSEKKDGSMIFALVSRELGFTNQSFYFKKLDLIDDYSIARPFIAHGNKVAVVTLDNFFTDTVKNVDGLITKDKKLILTVTAGDCLPIYFYDSKKEVVGIAHAGWKGVVSNIVGEMIHKMTAEFGTNPEDVLVYIGPHIRLCHFTVKDDIVDQFSKYKEFVNKNSDNSYSVDLSNMVRAELLEKGVRDKNITISSECTFCSSDKYFSYRRDKPHIVEAMVAYVGIR